MNDICGIEFWNALSRANPISKCPEGVALGYDGSLPQAGSIAAQHLLAEL
jgi:hypothetical protein